MHARLALLGGLVAALVLSIPIATAAPPVVVPATHEELGRAFDDFATHLHGLGERFRRHFASAEASPERPLVTFMLDHRAELGLTPAQTQELERIRSDFQKEAIKLDADQRVAEMDLAGLLRADPVDINRVEAKIREIERLRSDFRLGRIRAIERGKAQLTAEQRAKLATMLGDPPTARPRAGSPLAPQRF
jgi:Spy/CpxP family protein refolding chaperone